MTAEEVLLGILVACCAGAGAGGRDPLLETLRQAIYPLLVASQAIPMPIIAPLLVLWLGLRDRAEARGDRARLVLSDRGHDAGRRSPAVDPDLLKLMRSFDAPRPRTFWHVELPSALPGVLTGAKIAAVVAVIAAVLAELSGANSGLGYLYQ